MSEVSVETRMKVALSYAINYICINGRALKITGHCTYHNNAGVCCAVGCLLENAPEMAIIASTVTSSTWESLVELGLSDKAVFKPDFLDLPNTFLTHLQYLHDSSLYWDDSELRGTKLKLNYCGQLAVKKIREDFNLN